MLLWEKCTISLLQRAFMFQMALRLRLRPFGNF
ncbi:UNVERIFIED_CONTAM: hypothetical protein GTU68_019926 [Idotea baltica]|nr:hypothetical protein [Idotea baltica]